ncbi:hypothetical protein [Streptomyces sp. NPDC059247]|uniref:hypothetical protein n=1 Tax=Streptomyces sp. NPDC059247 TaxID=3346790 RepID=UPI0036795E78
MSRTTPRRRTVSRAGLSAAALLSALAAVLAAPAPASALATACYNYGCDGHDPNVQTWQSGPATASGPHDYGSGFTIELRKGTTDGDVFAWGRARYPNGSNGFEYGTYVERCRLDGTICEILPGKTLGTGGWTASGGTNYSQTRTPMYYDPSDRKVRACLYHNNTNDPWKKCTGWA